MANREDIVIIKFSMVNWTTGIFILGVGALLAILKLTRVCPKQKRVLRCNSAMCLKSVCATLVLTKSQHYGLLVTVDTHAAHAIWVNLWNTVTLC